MDFEEISIENDPKMNSSVNISTEPVTHESSNLRERKLEHTADGRLVVKRTMGKVLFCLVFMLVGAGMVTIGVVYMSESMFDRSIVAGMGALFMFVAVMAFFLGSNLVIDRNRGYVWQGKGDPDLMMDPTKLKKFARFNDILGIQILQKRVSRRDSNNRNSDYFCMEVNLVMRNGERQLLFVSGDSKYTEKLGRDIAEYMGKPIVASPDIASGTAPGVMSASLQSDLGSFGPQKKS